MTEIKITEAEIDAAATRVRVVPPASLPLDQHASYAREGIRNALYREKADAAARHARMDKQAEIKASLEYNTRLQEKKRAEERAELRQREEERFTTTLITAFFEANPSASEEDFDRNKKAIKDELLRSRTLEYLRNAETKARTQKPLL